MNYDNIHLKTLVHELSKDSPNSSLIKEKTEILGIPYSADMIILMSDVLVYLSQYKTKEEAV